MLVTAGAVIFMIYKQVDSGSFQQIHKDKSEATEQTPSLNQNETFANDDAHKQHRINDLLEKTDNLVNEGNFSEAKKSIEAALILQENGDNYMRQGFILKNLEEFDAAIESFQKSLEFEADNDMAYIFIGEIYARKNEYENAKEAFEKALSIDDSYDKTHLEYAKILIALKDEASAMTHLQKAVALDAQNEEAQSLLATLSKGSEDEKN
jgi:tetratricopeptide (TPR) repeat protein